jgi:hypothetical protein
MTASEAWRSATRVRPVEGVGTRILELHGDTYVDENIEPLMTAIKRATEGGGAG